MESQFSIKRNELERKAFLEENYNTGCFLSSVEKRFWIAYIAVQVLRTPSLLSFAIDCCKEEFGGVLNDEWIRDIAINYCLPFFSEIDLDKPESMLMKMMLSRLKDMYFSVGVDKSGRLITSDKAVYIYGQPEPNIEFEKVIFPITSKLCIVLSGGDEKKRYKRKNFLFPMDDRLRRIVFDSISLNASRWIFANHKMGTEELSWIDMIIEQRKDQ